MWLLILPSSFYAFPCNLVKKNLVLHQESNFYLIILSILITCLLDNVWILWGEVECQSLMRVEGLIATSDQDRISPYNMNAILSIELMRGKRNINKGIISSSNKKFSKLTTVRIITNEISEILQDYTPWCWEAFWYCKESLNVTSRSKKAQGEGHWVKCKFQL